MPNRPPKGFADFSRWHGTNETRFGFTPIECVSPFPDTVQVQGGPLVVVSGVVGDYSLSSGNTTPGKMPARKSTPKDAGKDQQMGSALRGIYQKTVEEAVPSEFLDLLGKLD